MVVNLFVYHTLGHFDIFYTRIRSGSRSNTKFSIIDRNKQIDQPLAFSYDIILLESKMNLCTVSNIILFLPRGKEHCHIKGETAREFDTVTLTEELSSLDVIVCSERSNVGHSLYCHTGTKEIRKYFSRKGLS